MLINKYSLQQFKENIEEVIQYSQGYEFSINTAEMIQAWAANKNCLYEKLAIFGGERLIYEYPHPVKFELTEESKKIRLSNYIRDLWDYPSLQDFIKKNADSFFSNKVEYSFKTPFGTVPKGMKIIKAFKYFFPKGDKQLHKLQDEASCILNQNTIEGIFCVSIHPLDYLSISENNNNWRSCHSLDGDYRTGNLNYMVDNSTAICYIREKDSQQKLPNFPSTIPWNSKVWRALLFFDVNLNMVMAGKQYPIECDGAIDMFQKSFEEFTPVYKYGPWHSTQINEIKMEDNNPFKFPAGLIPIGDSLVPVKKIFTPNLQSLQYNDIINNIEYNKRVKYAFLCSNNNWTKPFDDSGIKYDNNLGMTRYILSKTPRIEVGEPIICPCCNKNIVTVPDLMVCSECALEKKIPNLNEDYFYYCDNCGEPFIREEGTWHNDLLYCPLCAYELKEEK